MITKSNKAVLVHKCFRATEPFSVGHGKFTSLEIFHKFANASCRCAEFITYRERDRALAFDAAGYVEVYVVARPGLGGAWLPDWNEVVVAGKTKGPPWIQLLTAALNERAFAFGGNERLALHIELYGQDTQRCYVELGARWKRARAV